LYAVVRRSGQPLCPEPPTEADVAIRRSGMERLNLFVRLQAIVFVGYGLAFLLAPDFTLDTIFGWEGVETFFVRIIGVTFLGLGWLDWLVANRLELRLDMVWPLAFVPAMLLIVMVAVNAAGNYEGTDLFFWVSLGVTGFFALTVGGARLVVGTAETPRVDAM